MKYKNVISKATWEMTCKTDKLLKMILVKLRVILISVLLWEILQLLPDNNSVTKKWKITIITLWRKKKIDYFKKWKKDILRKRGDSSGIKLSFKQSNKQEL